MKKILLFFVLLAGLTACCSKPANYTVIISLDGSRWDYADYYDMPFFDSLATVGVKARMEPSFPSSTFPNHYTMATGLVPDHHGLVNNSFWDPETDGDYAISSKDARFDPHYYGGEPIWITAQKQGVKCGVVYWVGSDIAIGPEGNEYPTYWRHWDQKPHWNFDERVDEIVRLMSLPEEERPQLVMGYFDEPDHQGHVHGPFSPETKAMAEHMDSLMHALYLRLKGWYDVMPQEWTRKVVGSLPTSIWAKEGYVDSLYNRLSQVEHLHVWKHGEVPEYLHYGTSNRLGDLIVSPDLGWQFNFAPSRNHGAHGFDCKETDMMVAFRAVGPDFKVGYEAPFTEGEKSAFRNIDLYPRNIDLYPMLCKLLGIKPAPVDGKLERIEKIMK